MFAEVRAGCKYDASVILIAAGQRHRNQAFDSMKYLLALLLLLTHASALACSCAFRPLDGERVRTAEHVFVFRLLSARADEEAEKGVVLHAVTGEIEMLQTVRGGGVPYERVRYTTFSCCGTRLDIGHVYITFVDQDGPEFDGNIGSLLTMGSGTSDSLLDRVNQVMEGKAVFEDLHPGASPDVLSELPPPPPPCMEVARPQKQDT